MVWATLTDEQLAAEVSAGQAEIGRRARENHLVTELEEVSAAHHATRTAGDAWQPPASVVHAYPKGAVVTHDGWLWVNQHGGNTHEPGVAGWMIVPVEGDDPPPWVRPAWAEVGYPQGSVVAHDGRVWEAIWPAPQAWEPGYFADAWQDITPTDPGPEEPGPGYPAWVENTWPGYDPGQIVTHNGGVWRNDHPGTNPGNTWEPGIHGWTRLGDA